MKAAVSVQKQTHTIEKFPTIIYGVVCFQGAAASPKLGKG